MTASTASFLSSTTKTPFDIAKTAANISSDLEEYKDRLKEEDKKTYTDYLSKLNSVPDDVKAKYLSSGGAFSIDGNYTIFGQAIEGLDFLDKISAVEVSSGNSIDDEAGIASKPAVSIIIKKIEIATIPTITETEATTTTRKSIRPSATTPAPSDTTTAETPAPDNTTAAETTAQ